MKTSTANKLNHNFKLIVDYKNDEKLFDSFNKLAGRIFNINFKPWRNAGFCNERYICCSYLNGNEIIANVSVNFMDLIICGETKKAIQIGTVMTHPDYRMQGLSKQLMKFALDKYCTNSIPAYLFANESVYSFYPAFGFTETTEASSYIISAQTISERTACLKIKKMDISIQRDYDILCNLAQTRIPASKKLGAFNDSHLIMFYCINYYRNDIYYIENTNTIIIYTIEKNALCVFDILTNETGHEQTIMAAIARTAESAQVQKIIFMFMPDLFAPGAEAIFEKKDYKVFIKQDFTNNIGQFIFPRLSHA